LKLWQDKDQSPFGLKSLSAHRFLESTDFRRGLSIGVVSFYLQRLSVDSLHQTSLSYTGIHIFGGFQRFCKLSQDKAL